MNRFCLLQFEVEFSQFELIQLYLKKNGSASDYHAQHCTVFQKYYCQVIQLNFINTLIYGAERNFLCSNSINYKTAY